MPGVSRHPSIKIDGENLSELQSFLLEHGGEGKKLYAKENAKGETILYLKSGSNFLDRFRSAKGTEGETRADEKRRKAEEALSTLFINHSVKTRDDATSSGAKSIDRLLESIGRRDESFDHVSWNRDSQAVLRAIDGLKTFLDTVPKQADRRDDKPEFVPPSAVALLDTRNVVGKLAAADRKDFLASAERISAAIVDNYRTAAPKERADFVLALADKAAFKATLRQDLTSLPETGGKAVDDRSADELVEAVYKGLAAVLPTASFAGGPAKLIPNINNKAPKQFELTPVEFQGKVYEPSRTLGAGSAGAAFLYEDGLGGSIVVKLPLAGETAGPEEAGETAAEIRNFVRTGTGGHENVLGFHGAARLPGGAYAIISELAPNGTVHGFGSQVAADLASGALTDVEALAVRMSLIKDMAGGIAHMHQSGMTHYDFKTPNCLIGPDGRAKVMDFDASHAEASRTLGDSKYIDNPVWKAPEMLYGEVEFANSVYHSQIELANHGAGQLLSLANKQGDEIKTIMRSVTEKSGIGSLPDGTNGFRTDEKVDVWSLGASALELLHGESHLFSLGYRHSYEIEEYVRRFVKAGGDAIAADGSASFAPTTGHRNIDAFINRVLVFDPVRRPAASAVAADGIFDEVGAGSAGARGLIKAIAMPTGKKQDAMIEALDKRIADLAKVSNDKRLALAANLDSEDYDALLEGWNASVAAVEDARRQRGALVVERDAVVAARGDALRTAKDAFAAERAAA